MIYTLAWARAPIVLCLFYLLAGVSCGSAPPEAGDCGSAEWRIVEIMPQPHDGVPWLELYNGSDVPASLEGVTLTVGGGRPRAVHSDASFKVPPGGYTVLGAAAVPPVQVAIADGFVLPHRRGTVRLHCGDTLMSEVRYGAGQPLPAPQPGISLGEDPAMGLWCPSSGDPYDGVNIGTPNAANGGCAPRCRDVDGWRPVQAVRPDEVRIAAAALLPAGGDMGQAWVEVQITGTQPVDLAGLWLEQRLPTSQRRWNIHAGDCLRRNPGDRVALALGREALAPEFDAVAVGPTPLRSPTTLHLWAGTTHLDAVALPRAARGAAWLVDAAGRWCAMRGGSPGRAKPPCPVP